MKKLIPHSIFGLLLSLSVCISFRSSAQTNLVPDDQEFQALKALYDSLDGPNWTNKTNWPTPGNWPATATAAEMGTWFGVTVAGGDITALSFTSNNLTGKIPTAISQLSALTSLSCITNKITAFPAAVCSLNKLTKLYLNENQISKIPACINNITTLQYINLSTNQITGSIPDMSGLTDLVQLSLASNTFTPGLIPSWIGSLTKLRTLDLAGTNRNGPIPETFANLTLLTQLYLHVNQIDGSIPSFIGNYTSLTHLYLNVNQLTGPLPPELGNLSKLIYLTLGSNQLTGPIPASYGNLTKLEGLYLNTNLLTGSIPTSLGNLMNLGYLHLHRNRFSGEIPSSLGNLTQLRQFYIYQNQFSGTLPSSLGNLTQVQYFQAYSNQLTGAIPPSFSNLVELVIFNVSTNLLSGPVTEMFQQMTKLASLNLSGNNFNGPFPTSIGSCVSLTSVYGDTNKFSSVPSSILTLPLLNYINFEGNEISSIPDFSSHVNKAALRVFIKNNRLDFAQLEPLINTGILQVVYTPQKTINDVVTQPLLQGNSLVLTARPAGEFSTITWEKQNPNTTWATLTNDQDTNPLTYTRTTATQADEGVYRWKATNTKVIGLTVQSDPITVKTPTHFVLDDLAFQYKYDARKRMTHKKVPGADWMYMVYDDRDRLVMTQDGEQRKTNKWSFTKYDALNRTVMTGIYTHSGFVDQAGMSALISTTNFYEAYNGVASTHGYTNVVFPTSAASLEVLTVTYYDDYSFKSLINDPAFDYLPGDVSCATVNGLDYCQEPTASGRITGQITGSKTKVLGQPVYFWQTTYYDEKYRPVQTIAHNYKLGLDRQTSILDFIGKVLKTKTTHTVIGGSPLTITQKFDYDHAGRLLKTWHQVNELASVLLTENEYNELGQLVDKNLHSNNGSSFKQSIDYRYNIRGWLTSINNSTLTNDALTNDDANDLFGMYLDYNTPSGAGNAPQFNGNISGIRWSNNLALGDLKERAYNFSYDGLNRLKSATYKENTSNWVASPSFYEGGITYDLNGNITKLSRKGEDGAFIDSLTYDYGNGIGASNRLLAVTDATDQQRGFIDANQYGNDYTYDSNGNMTADRNKDVTSITYNHLNLPGIVTKSNGEYLRYTYDATGRKLAQEVFSSAGALSKYTDYSGDFVYENNKLQFINHPEGRVLMEGSTVTSMQLFPNPEANGLTGFRALSGVSLQAVSMNNENYVKVVCLQGVSTPGVISDYLSVEPGKQYTLKIKGYKTGTGKVHLYVHGLRSTDNQLYDILKGNEITNSEAEVINTFTVPAHTRKIKIGALWWPGVLNEELYVNSMELSSAEVQTFVPQAAEYQYHLKDHLGNVRLTFTTKDETENATATMEAASVTTEHSQFLNYDEAVKVNSTLFDHTDNGTTHYSTRLRGSTNEQYGLAKSLSVMPGDTIRIEVFAKYVDPNNANWEQVLSDLMTSIANGTAPAGTVVDGGLAGSIGNATFPYEGLLSKTSGGTPPKAFLNYIMFDRDVNPIFDPEQTNFIQVSELARETGTNGDHERLYAQVIAKQAGLMYIYFSNDNVELGGSTVEVFFDDFKVEHVKSPVIQTDDYYPFGLTFNSYSRENSVEQNYLFAGKELQKNLELNWEDFGARMYMPDIGRWSCIDPLAEKYMPISPYAYALNNPLIFVDHDGRDVIPTLSVNYSQVTRSLSSVHDLGSTYVQSITPIQRKDGNYDVKVNVVISMSNHFAGGPSDQNNPNSSFNKENPGLHNQVMAHEQGHNAQFNQVIQQDGYKYSVGGKEVSGKLDKVITNFMKALNKEIDALNKSGFSSEKDRNAAQEKIQGKIMSFYKSVGQQIEQKMNATFGEKDGIENDANEKATATLRKNGEGTNYINGQTPIKENGKEVPKN